MHQNVELNFFHGPILCAVKERPFTVIFYQRTTFSEEQLISCMLYRKGKKKSLCYVINKTIQSKNCRREHYFAENLQEQQYNMHTQTGCGAHPVSYPMGTGRDADH
jgi:hypothetical protein